MRRELTAKKVLTAGGSILLALIIAGYGVWISRDLLFGITNKVEGIRDGMTVTTPLLTLSGRARHATGVTVDGRSVPVDQKGTWSDTVALLPGYSVITIGASDKFGRTETKTYRVYYTEPDAVQ